jgi:hydrogenase/urease accessory protein HupE
VSSSGGTLHLIKNAVFLAVCLAGTRAAAHQASVSYSNVTIDPGGEVRYVLRVASTDLYEALGLDRDRDATDEEIRRGEARLFDYALARVRVLGDGVPCPVRDREVGVVTQAMRFAELRFTAACPLPLETVAIEYGLFFDLDPRHSGLLRVTHEGKSLDQELTRGLARFEWRLGLAPPPSRGAWDYVVSGMEHIYTGYDHIAFLVALLLVAAVGRALRPAAAYVVKVVTAFTVAHSITLILAALEVITLPSRFVESAIAASIVYVAVENLLVAAPSGRWPLAFLFGLVHGVGFASMLRPLLPPGDLVVPLLLFNVGVELGQLSIVLVLLPALALASARHPAGYRRLVVIGGSALIALLGLVWLVERVAGVEIFSSLL